MYATNIMYFVTEDDFS